MELESINNKIMYQGKPLVRQNYNSVIKYLSSNEVFLLDGREYSMQDLVDNINLYVSSLGLKDYYNNTNLITPYLKYYTEYENNRVGDERQSLHSDDSVNAFIYNVINDKLDMHVGHVMYSEFMTEMKLFKKDSLSDEQRLELNIFEIRQLIRSSDCRDYKEIVEINKNIAALANSINLNNAKKHTEQLKNTQSLKA